MKPQFQHEATTSFSLWLDNHLVNKLEAYSNKEGNLYYMPDERIPAYPEDPDGYISYNSEYKQWVYDNDATDANIPDGVFIDTGDGVYNFCDRGQSGLSIDFENGRVLLSGAYFPTNYDTLNIKADFSVKDINIYLSDDTEENLVIQSKLNKVLMKETDSGQKLFLVNNMKFLLYLVLCWRNLIHIRCKVTNHETNYER